MPDQRRPIELEAVHDVADVLHQRIDRVLSGRGWLVGQTVTLEIDGKRAITGGRQRGHVAAKHVRRAAPAVNQQYGRRRRITPFDDSHLRARSPARKMHAIMRLTGGKHLAGSEYAPAM